MAMTTDSRSGVLHRLKIARGHLDKVIRMVETSGTEAEEMAKMGLGQISSEFHHDVLIRIEMETIIKPLREKPAFKAAVEG